MHTDDNCMYNYNMFVWSVHLTYVFVHSDTKILSSNIFLAFFCTIAVFFMLDLLRRKMLSWFSFFVLRPPHTTLQCIYTFINQHYITHSLLPSHRVGYQMTKYYLNVWFSVWFYDSMIFLNYTNCHAKWQC